MEKTALTRARLAAYIDHTLLKPDATKEQILKICAEARQYHFASVCVNSSRIGLVAKELSGSGITPCCCVGFPLGACASSVKAEEAAYALESEAGELDMVANIGLIKDGNWDGVRDDLHAVNSVKGSAKLKVIIEACLLSDEEKVKVCRIAKEVGLDFVKTSTGLSTGGATASDVALMRKTVGPDMGVKAAGGIRTFEDAVAMIDAGASRIGTSTGVNIVEALAV